MNRNIDLNNENNPANPNNIYSPTLYFSRDMRHIYEPQSKFENYCQRIGNDQYRWKFPLNSCVIQVPFEAMEVAAFCCKLTPDHQARVIQPRLSRVHYPPISRLRGSTLFAKVMASARSFEALRRGEAMPTVSEASAAAAATERARRPLDPIAQARATQVSSHEAGVDTDDEADLNAQTADELEEQADLGAHVAESVRRDAEIRRLEIQRRKLLREVASRYSSKEPSTLNGWARDVLPANYDMSAADGTTDAQPSSNINPLLMSLDSNSGVGSRDEHSLTASQQVPPAERTLLSTYDHGDSKTRKHEREVNETAAGGAGVTALDTLALQVPPAGAATQDRRRARADTALHDRSGHVVRRVREQLLLVDLVDLGDRLHNQSVLGERGRSGHRQGAHHRDDDR